MPQSDNDRLSFAQRFWLVVFAMIVGAAAAALIGGLLWADGPAEAGIGRAYALVFIIAPAGGIACAIPVAYLTRARPNR
jgi:hypothetical protein